LIELQEGAFGATLVLTVRNHDGSVHAFTGDETVTTYVTKSGGSPVSIASSSINDADNGVIHAKILEADVDNLTHGIYEIRLKITAASQTLITEPCELSVGRGVE